MKLYHSIKREGDDLNEVISMKEEGSLVYVDGWGLVGGEMIKIELKEYLKKAKEGGFKIENEDNILFANGLENADI